MSAEWTAERWVEWLQRGPNDPAPSWRGAKDCADAIGKELARLRDVEKAHKTLLERIDALGNLVAANETGAVTVKAAWDIITEKMP